MAALRAATMATTIQKTCPPVIPDRCGRQGRGGEGEGQGEHRVGEADHPPVDEGALHQSHHATSTGGARAAPETTWAQGSAGTSSAGTKASAARLPGPRVPRSSQAEGLRPAGSGHADDRSGIQGRELAGQERGVLEDVEGLHAGEAVGAEAEGHPRRQQGGHVRGAHGEVPVAAGAQRHAHPALRQQLPIGGVEVHPVDRQHPRAAAGRGRRRSAPGSFPGGRTPRRRAPAAREKRPMARLRPGGTGTRPGTPRGGASPPRPAPTSRRTRSGDTEWGA